jgi:hypothetical protein
VAALLDLARLGLVALPGGVTRDACHNRWNPETVPR